LLARQLIRFLAINVRFFQPTSLKMLTTSCDERVDILCQQQLTFAVISHSLLLRSAALPRTPFQPVEVAD
jgi:hypothetical protein